MFQAPAFSGTSKLVRARTPPFCPYSSSAIDIGAGSRGRQVLIGVHSVDVLDP